VVIKERDRGRVVQVMTRMVYGTAEPVEAALRASPVRYPLKTYGVERQPLTLRQHAHRLGRQVKAFSKDLDYLEQQRPLAFASDHCVVPHRSLRPRLPRPVPTKGCHGAYKKWKAVTPALAAGATDHVWTMAERLSFRMPPKHVW
jgi:hypothetical protein